ncbi:hypothetical protein QBD01_005089 [Ochrobactrum sp. 19YEA23]|uniref:hypothetical protein n=1 Tax=Ochrobactrum sp. 19YEA23 TaxID=3039854 RepID=UPI002479D97A|nr:hypothetical protein [Ochrobactrum sp. 19YEA23]
MTLENRDDGYNKVAGSHRISADFSDSPNDKDVILETFSASWPVPVIPEAPHNQTGFRIWGGLRAYKSNSQIQLALGWDPDLQYYLSIIYIHDDGRTQVSDIKKIEPSGTMSFTTKVVVQGANYRYKLSIGSSQNESITAEYDLPCALNQAVLGLDLDSSDYRDLPPQDKVLVNTISVGLAPTNGQPTPLDKINWKNETYGVLIPSGYIVLVMENTNKYGQYWIGLR